MLDLLTSVPVVTTVALCTAGLLVGDLFRHGVAEEAREQRGPARDPSPSLAERRRRDHLLAGFGLVVFLALVVLRFLVLAG